MIYIVQILDGAFYKLGYSDGPLAKRIAELQTGSPFQIQPVLEVQGSLMQELALHASLNKAFARIRVPIPPNEWYPGKIDFMRDFIGNLKYGFDMGLTFTEQYNSAVRQPGAKAIRPMETNFRWAKLSGRMRLEAQ